MAAPGLQEQKMGSVWYVLIRRTVSLYSYISYFDDNDTDCYIAYASSASCGCSSWKKWHRLQTQLVCYPRYYLRSIYLRISGDNVNGANLSTIEICVAIISACLPTYRPLYKLIRYGHANDVTMGKEKSTGHYGIHYNNPVKSTQNSGIEMDSSAKCWATPTLDSGNHSKEELCHRQEPQVRL